MSDTARAASGRPTQSGLEAVGGTVQLVLALFAALVLLALVGAVVGTVSWLVLSASGTVAPPDRAWPRLTNIAIALIPAVAIFLAALLARRGGAGTFYSQQAANRRISLLFIIALIGLLTVLGEVIAASITFDAYAALAGAGVSALAGLGAAAFAHFRGPGMVLSSAGARPATDQRDGTLLNVVREISIAANMPPPRTYVIDDPSINAMAVGTRQGDGAIAVTRGMLDAFDREQLQGVVAHEMAHIRNLDSRYGVYVAILVGIVALVTDGFLRLVVRAWAEGAFFRGAQGDDAKSALGGLAAGVALGLLLLVVALFLRLFAPITALLVQAAVSRQREYLADATSVELTRNPVGLARALAALRAGGPPLRVRNRGSQHLWFTSPLNRGDDVGWHLLATHPTLEARINRLDQLFPAGVSEGLAAEGFAGGRLSADPAPDEAPAAT